MDISGVIVWLMIVSMGISLFVVLGQRDRAEQRVRELEATRFAVWAVVCGNYSPAEVDSLWDTKAQAQRRADELGDGWYVKCPTVYRNGEEYNHGTS